MIEIKIDIICVGKVLVMVNLSFCYFYGFFEKDLVVKGYCLFDDGGFFIIKGLEKVIMNF